MKNGININLRRNELKRNRIMLEVDIDASDTATMSPKEKMVEEERKMWLERYYFGALPLYYWPENYLF